MKTEKAECNVNKPQPLKVDFSKAKVQFDYEGKPVEADIRKGVGNAIRKGTYDIGVEELARQIYFSEGEVEIPGMYREYILALLVESTLTVPVKEAIKQLLTN